MKIDPNRLDISILAPLFAAFEESGARLFYVGGCIRNAVMGVAATDIDLNKGYRHRCRSWNIDLCARRKIL